jgi:hypothetical protein
MKILRTELRKLLTSRIFLLITGAVFVLNGYLMFRTANSGEKKPSDYREVYTAMEGLSDSEKLEWLDARLQEFSGQHHYNFSVLYELREECSGVVNYKEYLDSIDAQAKSMTSISIFARKGTFNYRNIQKTPPAYDRVRDVQPRFDVSKGIILATDNSFTDILLGFILLFSVLGIMLADREQGMSGLLFSTKYGRGRLLCAKLRALAAVLLGAVVLLYGENLAVSAFIYGLGDLSRPVQSLGGFLGCNLRSSVLEYLLVYGLFKFGALFAIGSLLTLIAVNTRNNVTFYGISAVCLVAEGLAYKRIEPLSVHSIFRYVNLVSFTKVNENFCIYRNINFHGYPVQLIITAAAAMLIFTALCTGLSVYLYGKKRNLEFRRIGLKFLTGRMKKVRSPLCYALYKSLILQKGAIVILVSAAVFSSVHSSFVKKYDYVDVYYRYYTEHYEGAVSQETYDFCESEEERFRSLHERLEELSESGMSNSPEVQELNRQLAPEAGYRLFRERIEKIRDTKNARIFYDTGYKRAFGAKGYDDDMRYGLLAMLMCVFLVSPLIAGDNRYRMSSVISSTRSGKRSYIRRNIFISVVYGMAASLLWMIPYAKNISDYYGHAGLGGGVRSIVEYTDFPVNLTVLQYIVMLAVLRTAAVILCAVIMLWVSSRCRSIVSAVLINFAVFVLPVTVYLLGAEAMVYIGFDPIISVNVLLNGSAYTDLTFVAAFAVIAHICSRRATY